MARHIMAVCVVCLLCADHLPCQQHVESLLPAPYLNTANSGQFNAVVYSAHLSRPINSKAQTKETTDTYASSSSNSRRRRRIRRHSSDHSHDHAHDVEHKRPEITEAFLKRIFHEFSGDKEIIHVQDFQRMLNNLGLHRLLAQESHKHDNINDNDTVSIIIL